MLAIPASRGPREQDHKVLGETLSQKPKAAKMVTVAQNYNPNTWEADAGRSNSRAPSVTQRP